MARPDSPGALLIEASRLSSAEQVADLPLAFVDFDSEPDVPEEFRLPPFPVVGFGEPRHPLASRVDVLLEPGFAAGSLIDQVMAAPMAAAATVQLLRMLPRMMLSDGLMAESVAYAMLQGSAEHRRWLAGRPDSAPAAPPGAVDLARAGDRLTITLATPETGNAIDRPMRDALFEALQLAALDEEIALVELRARGKAFSLGADLGEFGTTTDPATAHAIRLRTLPARQAVRCAGKLEAHVQGACVGAGLELAAWARRITASRTAWFQLPELAMGILPGAGGCVSLTRRIGRQRTALMILSGRRLGARRALEWGLVDAIVDEPA